MSGEGGMGGRRRGCMIRKIPYDTPKIEGGLLSCRGREGGGRRRLLIAPREINRGSNKKDKKLEKTIRFGLKCIG